MCSNLYHLFTGCTYFKVSRQSILLLLWTFSSLTFTGCGIVGYGGRGTGVEKPNYHVVQRGESLYQIGQKYGVPHERIAKLNGIRNPEGLKIGSRLLIGYSYSNGYQDNSKHGAVLTKASYGGKGLQRGKVVYKDGRLGWPIAEGEVLSRFGKRGRSFHDGIDIRARVGTPVLAAHDGVVLYSGNGLSGYGNLVILRSRTGLTTVYAHNRRNLVRVGEAVGRGERIAEVGSTGRATGPHLHFEVRMRDSGKHYVAVDPLPFFKKSVNGLVDYRVNEKLTPILTRAR